MVGPCYHRGADRFMQRIEVSDSFIAILPVRHGVSRFVPDRRFLSRLDASHRVDGP